MKPRILNELNANAVDFKNDWSKELGEKVICNEHTVFLCEKYFEDDEQTIIFRLTLHIKLLLNKLYLFKKLFFYQIYFSYIIYMRAK